MHKQVLLCPCTDQVPLGSLAWGSKVASPAEQLLGKEKPCASAAPKRVNPLAKEPRRLSTACMSAVCGSSTAADNERPSPAGKCDVEAWLALRVTRAAHLLVEAASSFRGWWTLSEKHRPGLWTAVPTCISQLTQN